MIKIPIFLFIIYLPILHSICTSVQISNPNKNTLVAIESEGSESFRKKQYYLLFGTVPLNKIKSTDMFPDEKASYHISEEATWVDFMISALGGQLVSLSSKTIIVKKCDGASIARFEKDFNTTLEEKQKKIVAKLTKESAVRMEALNHEKIKFENEKESLITSAVEKKKAEFEKEYAAKKTQRSMK